MDEQQELAQKEQEKIEQIYWSLTYAMTGNGWDKLDDANKHRLKPTKK